MRHHFAEVAEMLERHSILAPVPIPAAADSLELREPQSALLNRMLEAITATFLE